MKKIIFRTLLIVFLILSIFVIFLSTSGIETKRLNNQISNSIKNFDKNLEIKLKKVKIILNPFKFEINAKTLGSEFKINGKTIEIESIKTNISIHSLINNDFSLRNLNISTKSLSISNLISFSRNIKNSTELFVLEKFLKKGYLVFDIDLEFDSEGKIKNNYEIKGFVKDAKIDLFKKYDFKNINFFFNFTNNNFRLENLEASLNDIPIKSEKILVKSFNNKFLVEGFLKNNQFSFDDDITSSFIRSFFPKFELSNIDLISNNQFSFIVNKKFKIDNFKLLSKIELLNLELVNNLKLQNFFKNIKNKIDFNNHFITARYENKILSIDGSGDILFQNKKDLINYSFQKLEKKFNFETNLEIDANPFVIDFLGYKKKSNTKASAILKGVHYYDKKTIIESFSFKENENKFNFDQLTLDKNFKIKKINKINLNYLDDDMRKNDINISHNNNVYNIEGSEFNANNLIERIINTDDSNNLEIFNKNFGINLKINQVFLDKEYVLNDLNGKLNLKKNEISDADIKALFSKNKKFNFTVRTNQQEKVTTLFLDESEPIVKRYKFIKGFKGGSLDFYSSKKNDTSVSNLKIYNFRLKELPVLTKLLTLASLQGIADILSGEGITFDEFEMNFKNKKDLITIQELYAIGPAISILMDGYVEKNKLISLRGSLVPATTINKAIGNIPILGKILVGSRTGEGVFGVSFKIKGPPKNLETSVNPIKTLTPRFITRTLEKIKKN